MWTSKILTFLPFGQPTCQDCRPPAGFDPLRDEARAYADALERAGAKVRYVCHEQMIHNFYAMAGAIPYAETSLKAVGADIKAALTPLDAPIT